MTAYCGVKKGISYRRGRLSRPVRNKVLRVVEVEKPALFWSDIALSQTILSIKTKKKPIIYFLYLRNPNLPIRKKIFSFLNPNYLSKHFREKYVKKFKMG